VVWRPGNPLREQPQEGLVRHHKIAVRREASANLERADDCDCAALDLESVGLAGANPCEQVLRNVAGLSVDQGHIGEADVGKPGVDRWISERLG
jgi:hypothetical protein